MENSGWWGSKYFKLEWWADNFWFENALSAGEPKLTFDAEKSYVFDAKKTYLFDAIKTYVFRRIPSPYTFFANKVFIGKKAKSFTPSDLIFAAQKSYAFRAVKDYTFDAGKTFTFRAIPRPYILNADRIFTFRAAS